MPETKGFIEIRVLGKKNLSTTLIALTMLTPAGIIANMVEIVHGDPECPCVDGTGEWACTCEVVTLHLPVFVTAPDDVVGVDYEDA